MIAKTYSSILIGLLSIMFLTSYSCTDSTTNPSNSSKSKTSNLNSKAFKSMLTEKQYTLVDVRTSKEFKKGHIEGAININISSSSFKKEISKIDKSKPVMVYCRSGARSGKAMSIMKKLEFSEIHNLKGGFKGWKRAGL